MPRFRSRPALPALLLLVVAGSAAAQQRTNRDQSGYTELHEPGFPTKSGLTSVPVAQAALRDDDLILGVVAGGEARAWRATRGARSGLSLRKKTWTVTTWGRWGRLHPETSVYADTNLPVPLALLLVVLPAASNPSEDARAALARGAALHQKGDVEGAVAAYRESLALAPSVETRSNLGGALAALRRYEEAIESYRGALAMVPSDRASGTTSLAAAIASAAR